jgi:hypothetical protein
VTPPWLLAATVVGWLAPGTDTAPPPTAEPDAAPEATGPDSASPPAIDTTAPPSPEADPPVTADTAEPDTERLQKIESKLDDLAADNTRLRKKNATLEERVQSLEEGQEQTKGQLDQLVPLSGRLGGYVDFGFFWVGGDGSGIRPDTAHVVFPEYDGVVPDSWVFMGDPLSTQINSRGDPADTSESRAILLDGVDSRGKSSFIANALNLDLTTGVGDQIVVEGMVDFIPRNRDVSSPDGVFLGDYINVKLAYVNWIVPTKRIDLDLYAGKIDTVFGYEYRIQESPDRITVTPSLLCRYTCGRPVGLKGRVKLLPNRALIFGASVANGSSFREAFAFSNETDTNHFKTAAARLSYRLPVGAGLEIGASGQFGAQDLQPADDVYQWQYGFDVHLDVRGLDLTGEFIMGKVDGATTPGDVACAIAPCLEYKAAYGLVGYHVLNWLMPYARADWRDALHQSGASFVYVSQLVRFTPGVRFDLGTHIAIKAEYTLNRELGRLRQFNNDVVTTSLVAKI